MPPREPVARTSDDPTANRLAQLRELFPDAFADGKLDFEKLRAAVGEVVPGGTERFQFTWAGRSDAVACLQTPTRATLLPCEEESVDFAATKNLFLEGDNLEVLKLLYKPYHGRVKLIYIDPPYNTGQDFIYPDDFKDTLANYLRLTNQSDDAGNLLRSNPDTSGRYHSDWLSMMYPRLFLARQLLRDDGVIFVSIDDHEVHHLRMLMNEVFGEENFVANIVWQKRYVSNVTAKYVSDMHDHILVFAKDVSLVSVNKLARTEEQLEDYKNPDSDPRGVWRAQDLSASKPYKAGQYEIETPAGIKVNPPPGRYWRCHREQYDKWISDNRITFGRSGNGRPMLKAFLSEVSEGLTPHTWWGHEFAGHNKEATLEVKELFGGESPFDTAKPVKLIRRILDMFSLQDSLILDFFSGSGTTAQAVLELNREDGGNRRFILVQLPEPTGNKTFPTIAEIGKERIRRVIANLRKETGNLTRTEPEDLGFKVFKLAESHYANWSGLADRTPEAYQKQLRIVIESPLRDDWTHEGLLWEIAVKEGFGLNSVLTPVDGHSVKVYKVADPEKGQQFLACFAKQLPEDITKQLGLTIDDLFVVLDAALDDTLASNLALQCKLKTI